MSWWETEPGRETRRYFSTYGEVAFIRMVTGDPSAVPSFDGTKGSGRGSPGDISSASLMADEVEAFLKKYATGRQRDLVDFVYRDGSTDMVSSIVYVLPDGSRSDPLKMNDPAPVDYVGVESETRRVFSYDMRSFPDPAIDQVMQIWYGKDERCWQSEKAKWLERELVRIGKRFAKVRGL